MLNFVVSIFQQNSNSASLKNIWFLNFFYACTCTCSIGCLDIEWYVVCMFISLWFRLVWINYNFFSYLHLNENTVAVDCYVYLLLVNFSIKICFDFNVFFLHNNPGHWQFVSPTFEFKSGLIQCNCRKNTVRIHRRLLCATSFQLQKTNSIQRVRTNAGSRSIR